MQVGWPGLSRAVCVTMVLTSAFWVALGAWLFQSHLAAEHEGGTAQVASPSRVATNEAAKDTNRRPGWLAAFGGGAARPVPSSPTGQSVFRPGASGLMIPVVGVQAATLTDTFTQARAEGARVHDAIDIMAAEGTPVIAAAPGRVEKLFVSGEGGNTIYVRSLDRRRIYYYAHLASYAADLREGMTVKGGQRLGSVGHTGNASPEAPHLHFAIWTADPGQGWNQDQGAINPYPLLGGKGSRPQMSPAQTENPN